MLETPILYLAFNRPEDTALSFLRIRDVKPKCLYIACDGPRKNSESDYIKCGQVINVINELLDWHCEVKWLVRKENLGCGKAVSNAIDWFFSQVEYGIILEDDCLPNDSFFEFCTDLLLRYKDNKGITHISGHNNQMGIWRGGYDYYFSRVVNIWGWATWRRAWDSYCFNIDGIEKISDHPNAHLFPVSNLSDVIDGTIDTWDTQWLFVNFLNNNLTISPNINMVENIGFSENATHTNFAAPGYLMKNRSGEYTFPLRHPVRFGFNQFADLHAAAYVYKIVRPGFILKIVNRLYKYFKIAI